MKNYSRTIRKMREADNKIVKFFESDALITSEEFINTFRGYIDDIAVFRTDGKRKLFRSTQYAAIGIMDINDVYQEAYLAFLEGYKNLDWSKINKLHESERGAMIWSFLKKSTILNLEQQLRGKKDGIRVTEWGLFKSESVNTNMITKLFNQLDRLFFRNQEDISLTSYETDLINAFMDVHMDEYLDLTRDGNRDLRKNERAVLKSLYGLELPLKTYKELSEHYRISQSTLRSIKERAIKRLQSEESKEIIANFLHEYRIGTQADTEKYRK